MFHPHYQEELDSYGSRDHIEEAYGPTAADAAICGIEDALYGEIEIYVQSGGSYDDQYVKDLEAQIASEVASIRARWGI